VGYKNQPLHRGLGRSIVLCKRKIINEEGNKKMKRDGKGRK
jgi:hypothetical protein